jgi:pantoate--beta-alanine ligase
MPEIKLVKSEKAMRLISTKLKRSGKVVGFVPTMGALHEGHLSLIRKAGSECDAVVCSIFVNPTQFGPKEDFKKYPRNLKRDLELAKSAGVDIIFAPSVNEMYPQGYCSFIDVEGLSDCFEGKARPGHFRGVATVVARLFGIVCPDIAYFGQKDYQQALIIKKMVEDLRIPVSVKVLPTLREEDGLAMSSRNVYLDKEQRKAAPVIFKALSRATKRILEGEESASIINALLRKEISKCKSMRIDYAIVVDAKTLNPIKRLDGKIALVVAARIGKIRLIDNFLVDVP